MDGVIPEAFLAPIIVANLIDEIVDEAVAEVYDKELAQREVQFAIDRCIEEAVLQTNAKFPVLDVLLDQHRPEEYRFQHRQKEELELLANCGSWEPEEEPPTVPVDSWASAVIPVRVKTRPPKRDDETMAKRAQAAQVAKALASSPKTNKPNGGSASGNGNGGGANKDDADKSTAGAVVPGMKRTLTRRGSTSSIRSGTTSVLGGASKSVAGSATAGTVVSRAQPMDDGKKAALVVKALKGKTLTYDDRGNPQIVNQLPPTALPPSVLPVTVQIEPPPAKPSPSKSTRSPGGKGGNSAANNSNRNGGGVTFGNDSYFLAHAGNANANGSGSSGGNNNKSLRGDSMSSGGGRGRSPSGRMGSKKGLGSPAAGGGLRSSSAGSGSGSSASAGSPSRGPQFVVPRREVEKHFRPQPGGQPPLPETLEQSGLLSPGVTVSQGKRNAMASKPKIAGAPSSAPSSPTNTTKGGASSAAAGGATMVQRMGATMTKQEFDRTLASGDAAGSSSSCSSSAAAAAADGGNAASRAPPAMRKSNAGGFAPAGLTGVAAAEETLRRRALRTKGGGGLRGATINNNTGMDAEDDQDHEGYDYEASGEQRQYRSLSPLRHSSDSLSAAVAASGTGRAYPSGWSQGASGILQAIPDLTTTTTNTGAARPGSGTLRSAAFGTLGGGGGGGGPAVSAGGAPLPVGVLVPPSPPRTTHGHGGHKTIVPVGEQATTGFGLSTARGASSSSSSINPAFSSTNVLNRGLAAAATAAAVASSHPPVSTIGVGTVIVGSTAPAVVPVGAAGASASVAGDVSSGANASGSVKPGSGLDFAAKAAAKRAEAVRNREYAARPQPVGLTGDEYGSSSSSSAASSVVSASNKANLPAAMMMAPRDRPLPSDAANASGKGALPVDLSKRPRDRVGKASGVHSNEHAPAPPFGKVAHFEGTGAGGGGGGPASVGPGGEHHREGPEDDDMLVIDGSVAGEEPSGELDAETGQLLPSRIRAVADQSINVESPSESPSNSHSARAAAAGGGQQQWGRKR